MSQEGRYSNSAPSGDGRLLTDRLAAGRNWATYAACWRSEDWAETARNRRLRPCPINRPSCFLAGVLPDLSRTGVISPVVTGRERFAGLDVLDDLRVFDALDRPSLRRLLARLIGIHYFAAFPADAQDSVIHPWNLLLSRNAEPHSFAVALQPHSSFVQRQVAWRMHRDRTMPPMPEPRPLGQMLIYGRVSPLLSRGDMPYADSDYRALAGLGVNVFVNLRASEGERIAAGRHHPPFDPIDEANRCAAEAMAHLDFGREDFKPISPSDLEQILSAIAREHAVGRHVFVHCLGGVGRTGFVSACWMTLNGWTADESAQSYLDFVDYYSRHSLREGETLSDYYPRIKATDHWLAILQFAARQGLAVTVTRDYLPKLDS